MENLTLLFARIAVMLEIKGGKAQVNKILQIIKDLSGYLQLAVGAITGMMIAYYGLKFLTGDAGQKQESIQNIKSTIMMSVGIFLIIWFAGVLIDMFK